MNRAVAGIVAATIVVTVSLTGCTADLPALDESQPPRDTASSTVETSSPAPSGISTAAPTAEPTCVRLARIDWRGERIGEADEEQVATGEPFDDGAREGAAGTAHLDADGRVIGYTVAAGDVPSVIEDRFCIDGLSVLHFNGYWVTGDGKDIAPNDYLYLAPNPAVTYAGPDL